MKSTKHKILAIILPSFLFLQLITSGCEEKKEQEQEVSVISYEIVDIDQIEEGKKQLHVEATLRVGYEAVLNKILKNTGELPSLNDLQLYAGRIVSSTQLITPKDGEKYKLLHVQKLMKPQEHEGEQYYYLLFSIPKEENNIELRCYDPLIGLIKEEKSL